MRMRPVDGTGDILPVLSSDDLVTGARAVAILAEERLRLLAGDWWENPEWGCEILSLLQDRRQTDADARAISTYLSAYVQDTPGVRDVRDESWTFSDGRLNWSCTVITEYGKAEVSL